jgi:hypothetical protein
LYRSYLAVPQLSWERAARQSLPTPAKHFPFDLSCREENFVGARFHGTPALRRKTTEHPFSSRFNHDRAIAMVFARPSHAVQDSLQLITVRTARRSSKFLYEIDALCIDLVVCRGRVNFQHLDSEAPIRNVTAPGAENANDSMFSAKKRPRGHMRRTL